MTAGALRKAVDESPEPVTAWVTGMGVVTDGHEPSPGEIARHARI